MEKAKIQQIDQELQDALRKEESESRLDNGKLPIDKAAQIQSQDLPSGDPSMGPVPLPDEDPAQDHAA